MGIDAVKLLEEIQRDGNKGDQDTIATENLIAKLLVDVTHAREDKNLTQTNLAKLMNSKQSVISRFENRGRIPGIAFLVKLAKALGHELLISIFGEYQPRLRMKDYRYLDQLSEDLGKPVREVSTHLFREALNKESMENGVTYSTGLSSSRIVAEQPVEYTSYKRDSTNSKENNLILFELAG